MIVIKAVIIEDSRLARNELKELIRKYPEIQIEGEAENVDDAFILINKTQPDIIFLDINMPEKNGFELLEMLTSVPIVIFTTAFDEYAIKSFQYNALDYLLKPISEKRFSDAIEKAKHKLLSANQAHAQEPERLNQSSRIFIKDGEKCWLVNISEIQLFEIVGNYTRVYFNNEKPLIYKSLNQIEERLPEKLFFRANRQQIINIQYIKNVENGFSSKLKVLMQNNTEIEISRRQSLLFKEKLSL